MKSPHLLITSTPLACVVLAFGAAACGSSMDMGGAVGGMSGGDGLGGDPSGQGGATGGGGDTGAGGAAVRASSISA